MAESSFYYNQNASLIVNSIGQLTVSQVRQALAILNVITTVAQGLSAEYTDPANLEWNDKILFTVQGPLYQAIQNILGWNQSQMATMLSLASLQTK